MKIELKILNKNFYKEGFKSTGGEDLIPYYDNLPKYATPASAAMDLICPEEITLLPGEVKVINTGLAIWAGSHGLDEQSNYGVAALILPRSGLGTRGLVLANTVGVIDESYQGALIVQAWNRNPMDRLAEFSMVHRGVSDQQITIIKGERFAQLMFVPIIKAQFNIVEQFSADTKRAAGGFGSTGRV